MTRLTLRFRLGIAAALTICVALSIPLWSTGAEAPAAKKTTAKNKAAKEKKPADKLSEKQQQEFFEQQVVPILQKNCFKCHGAKPKVKGELRLTDRASVLAGGETGPAVSIDSPDESVLIDAINYGDLEMPPKKKLPQEQIDILTRWAKLGAPWSPNVKIAAAEPAKSHGTLKDRKKAAKTHWAFQRINRPQAPQVKQANWVTNPIDAFILARLEAKGFTPAAPAEKTALLRRAHYDITGLPPSPAQIAAFLADKSPDAYEKVVDRLLQSPHYGEKWARHWLDLVHYAESNSFERDNPKPEVWRYRDYVIRAFNQDKPYDQFLREQIAGDELKRVTADSIIATGVYRLGLWDDESSDAVQTRYDELDDWVTTTSQVYMGLAMNCCRCHEHKLDPFDQKEYYGLVELLRGVRSFQNDGRKGFVGGKYLTDIASTLGEAERRKLEEAAKKFDAENKKIGDEMAALEKAAGEKLPNGGVKDDFAYPSYRLDILNQYAGEIISQKDLTRYRQLHQELERLKRARAVRGAKALSAKGTRTPRQTHLMIRGNAHVKGDPVEPMVPVLLGGPPLKIESPAEGARSSGRRRALADWLTHRDHPLTARVIVNRLWQHHFGRGIVRSPNNFGLTGDAPTHPQLMDWLAVELMENGWRLKSLHKKIMLSSAYRMSSASSPKALAADPTNNLFWRFNMRRMTAEEIRDSILAVNGRLNLKMGGPSIFPTIPREVLAGQSRPGANWHTSSPEEQARRSVYVHIKRSLILPEFERFDFADTDSTCAVRFATTQPTQALGMLNSVFMNQQAEAFAKRITGEVSGSTRDQVARGLRLALQRSPSEADVARGLKLIEDLKKEGADESTALKYFCLMVLNLNEFVYLD